jgi:polyphosphate kinase
MPDKMLKVLANGVGLDGTDVYKIDGFVDIPDLMQLYGMDRPELRDRPIPLFHPAALTEKKSVFDVVKKRDVFLHHPYMAYSALTDFVAEAAEDPMFRRSRSVCIEQVRIRRSSIH